MHDRFRRVPINLDHTEIRLSEGANNLPHVSPLAVIVLIERTRRHIPERIGHRSVIDFRIFQKMRIAADEQHAIGGGLADQVE
jgi:hypothetical protein